MGGATLTRTAFDSVQRRIPGARFTRWQGWEWIAGFASDPASEHHAVRLACGVWDKSPLQKWAVTGPDALLAADRFFTNDMRSMRPGQVRYGAFCDDDGRMLGDGTVFALAADSCWVITALEGDGDALCEAADGLEFAIRNVTAEAPNLQLQGPESRSVLGMLSDAGPGVASLLPLHAGADRRGRRAGAGGALRLLGRAGLRAVLQPASAERLWDAILATGRVTPYGLDAVETLRQESGLIFIGRDYVVGETSPYEVNLDRVVRLEKTGFRGCEALRRIAAAPPRRLTTLFVDGGDVPHHGATVTDAGTVVGEVRSACLSPTLGRVIALAVLDVPRITPGGRLELEIDGGRCSGVVAGFPVYDPDKLRPRA